jgi:hypothetical protein
MANGTSDSKAAFDLVLGKATDKFDLWQQIPAWVLGLAAILGGAALIAFPKHLSDQQTRDAWTAVIVALFLAVLLSYRSALTLSEDGSSGGQQASRNAPGASLQAANGAQLADQQAAQNAPDAAAAPGRQQSPPRA